MKKYGYYKYQAFYTSKEKNSKGYVYEIYSSNDIPELVRESSQLFNDKLEAEIAATNHIDLFENGEGQNETAR